MTQTVQEFNTMGLVDLVDDPGDKRTTRVLVKPQALALLDQIHQSIGPDLARLIVPLGAGLPAALLGQLGRWLDQNRLP